MIETLRYGLNERGIHILTSYEIVHAVSARRGAMLDDLSLPASQQVHQRISVPDGVVVNFDLMGLGKGYSGQRQWDVAEQIFEIIQQIEDVAAKEDWQDPRIEIACPGTSRFEYIVDVERPRGTDLEVKGKIIEAMLRSARDIRMNNTLVGDRRDIQVEVDTQHGISLTTHYGHKPTLSTEGADYSPLSDRIELRGVRSASSMMGQQALERLVSFTGILSTLREIE